MSSEQKAKRTTSSTRKAQLAKKRRKRKIMLIAVEVLVLILLAAVLAVVLKLSRIEKSEVPLENIEINQEISSEAQEIMEQFTTIALFGLDNRSNGNLSSGRSDVIMVATINNDTKEVKVCSVYRDTYLDLGNGKFNKCNGAYAAGGPEQAINMLNKNLDLAITDYVTVDFNAVVKCVDLLGGVEITVTDLEAEMMYGYINEVAEMTDEKAEQLPGAGTYNLTGVQACAYARVRQTAGDDYKRTERQRLVIQKMFEKAQKADLGTINKIIDTVFDDIQTSFSNAELIALAAQVFDYKLGDMSGFPFEKNSTPLGSKGEVVVPCDLVTNVTALHEFLYGNTDYEPTSTVEANSKMIINETGFSSGDGY